MNRVLIGDYFDIIATKQDDKKNFSLSSITDRKALPFLGRSQANNGVVDYVEPREGMINESNQITLALDGSTGSTFYQHTEFCSGQNIWILKPKESSGLKLTPRRAMFLITTIKKAVVNYSYNLSLTKTRISNVKFLVPLTESLTIDCARIDEIMEPIRNIELIDEVNKTRLQFDSQPIS